MAINNGQVLFYLHPVKNLFLKIVFKIDRMLLFTAQLE